MKHRNIRNASHLGEHDCIQFKVKKNFRNQNVSKYEKIRELGSFYAPKYI